jgi:hypothetical protein
MSSSAQASTAQASTAAPEHRPPEDDEDEEDQGGAQGADDTAAWAPQSDARAVWLGDCVRASLGVTAQSWASLFTPAKYEHALTCGAHYDSHQCISQQTVLPCLSQRSITAG